MAECTCFTDEALGAAGGMSPTCREEFDAVLEILRTEQGCLTPRGWAPESIVDLILVDTNWKYSDLLIHADLDPDRSVEVSQTGLIRATSGHTFPVHLQRKPVEHDTLLAYYSCSNEEAHEIIRHGITPTNGCLEVYLDASFTRHYARLVDSHFTFWVNLSDLECTWTDNGQIAVAYVPIRNVMVGTQCTHGFTFENEVSPMELDRQYSIINHAYFLVSSIGGGLSDMPRTTFYEFYNGLGDQRPALYEVPADAVHFPREDKLQKVLHSGVGETQPAGHCCCYFCHDCEEGSY